MISWRICCLLDVRPQSCPMPRRSAPAPGHRPRIWHCDAPATGARPERPAAPGPSPEAGRIRRNRSAAIALAVPATAVMPALAALAQLLHRDRAIAVLVEPADDPAVVVAELL